MEKVILITSREIGNLKKAACQISSYANPEEIGNGLPKFKPSTYLGLLYTEEWNKHIAEIKPLQLAENVEYGTNNKEDTDALVKYAKENITNKIDKVKQPPFIFGISFYKEKYDQEDYYVYFAEEFPFKETAHDKQRYLNAIVGEIQNHLKTMNVDNAGWTIFSHDKDWVDYDANKKMEKSDTSIDEEFSFLKELFENETTIVYLFTHTRGIYHKYVQKLITGGFMPFDNFKEGSNTILEKSKTLVTKERLEEKDIREFIQCYNPELPIFETPYNIN
ncbi:MAG: hypothetical protein IKS94_02800 [Prevotella sp.]|nr:hypothetical protein [Prevotella sp.]